MKGFEGTVEKVVVPPAGRFARFSTAEKGTVKYQVYCSLTDHKKRNYKSLENAVKSIVKLIDEKVERAAYIAEAAKKSEKAATDKIELLTEALGFQVYTKEEYKLSTSRGGRGYSYDTFNINIGKRRIIVNYDKNSELFTVGSFGSLSLFQAKAIIEALSI